MSISARAAFLIFAAAMANAQGNDLHFGVLHTLDGQNFSNAFVMRKSAAYATVMFDAGGARIAITNLPESVQRALRFDPSKAAAEIDGEKVKRQAGLQLEAQRQAALFKGRQATAGDALLPRDLGPTLRPLAEKYNLPGVVAAVLHGDQIAALGSAGVRKAGDSTPFLSSDLIHLGSDTKAMTAILIGQLVDRNQLALDATMREIFPDLAAEMNPAMARVTVRNLLDHNGGFPHDLDWWALNATRLSLPSQRRLAVKQALSVAPANPIGKFFYSNISFVLLGAIIEAKTGLPWEQVIQREIFQPLRMSSAGFGAPGINGTMDQPWGHVLKNGELKSVQFDNAPVMGPAGTVHCSITDWAKFIAEILHAAEGHSTLVCQSTFDALTEPPPGQGYAGGWAIAKRPWAAGRVLNHSGSNTSWYCTVWIAPKKDFAILIATNTGVEPVAQAVDKGVGLLIDFNSRLAAMP